MSRETLKDIAEHLAKERALFEEALGWPNEEGNNHDYLRGRLTTILDLQERLAASPEVPREPTPTQKKEPQLRDCSCLGYCKGAYGLSDRFMCAKFNVRGELKSAAAPRAPGGEE